MLNYVAPSWTGISWSQLGSADPVQLNGRGYTVDDADWSTTFGLRANYNDVTVTCDAYETAVQIGRNLFEF